MTSSMPILRKYTVRYTLFFSRTACSLCPKFGEYEIKFRSSSVWKNHQNVTKAVLDAVSKAVNFTVGMYEACVGYTNDCAICIT